MTIANQLIQLNTIKQNIKTAINNKGGSVGNDFNAYANAITNLPSGVTGGTIVYGKADVVTIEPYDSTVKTIGDRDFQSWMHATGLVLGEGFETVNEYAFFQWSNATSLSLPASLKAIAQYAFSTWTKCTSITIKEGLDSVGIFALSSNICTNIEFPNSLKTVGGGCVANCSQLLKLKFGTGVTSMSSQVILGCTKLQEFTIMALTPPTITVNTLQGIPTSCVIKVPSASLSAYQTAANWSAHASKMIGI